MSKNTTDFTNTTKNTTDWTAGSALTDAVKLSSTTVLLSSTTVTLLGYTAGAHFFDTKNTTDWSTP